MQDQELEALAQAIALRVQRKLDKNRPKLLPDTCKRQTEPMDPATRRAQIRHLRVIRRALKYMRVELFFEQALAGKNVLEDLTDEEIIELHNTIEKAREHYHTCDGVSYYEAGLLRSQGL